MAEVTTVKRNGTLLTAFIVSVTVMAINHAAFFASNSLTTETDAPDPKHQPR